MNRIYTNMRACISMETRVVITLSRLGSENILSTCGEIYGQPSTTFIIVRECCAINRTFLKPLVKIKIIAMKFEPYMELYLMFLESFRRGTHSVKFGIYVRQTTISRGDIK
jgi:hypothetical protein